MRFLSAFLAALFIAATTMAQSLPSPSYKDVSVKGKMTVGANSQEALGQIGQYTSVYPSISSDVFRVEVGGFPVAGEYSNANPTTSAIVGAIMTPSGATTSVMSDVGVSGYARTNTVNRPAMGLYGSGGIGVTGGSAWGLNVEPVNCENHASACGVNTGYDFGLVYGAEANIAIYSKAGGAAPSGSADGFVASASGNIQPAGSYAGFHAARYPVFTNNAWKYAFVSDDGSANRAASFGSLTQLASSASQAIEFVNRSAGNVRQFNYLSTDNLGALNYTNDVRFTKAGNVSLALVNTAAPNPWYMIAASGGFQIYDTAVRINVTSTATTINTDLSVNGTVFATSGLRIPFGTPATSSGTCGQGQVQMDATYIYSCIATNTWRRTSVGATW